MNTRRPQVGTDRKLSFREAHMGRGDEGTTQGGRRLPCLAMQTWCHYRGSSITQGDNGRLSSNACRKSNAACCQHVTNRKWSWLIRGRVGRKETGEEREHKSYCRRGKKSVAGTALNAGDLQYFPQETSKVWYVQYP